MKYPMIKAILYHDYKAVRMLVLSFMVIYLIFVVLAGASSISIDEIRDASLILLGFYGIILGAGIRSRDERV